MRTELFKSCLYYVYDKTASKFYPFKTMYDALAFRKYDEPVLYSVPVGAYLEEKPSKLKSIVLDFYKKELTLKGDGATINFVQYEEGVNKLDDEELKDFSKIIKDCHKQCKSFKIIGTPSIEGKDITDEMSDL